MLRVLLLVFAFCSLSAPAVASDLEERLVYPVSEAPQSVPEQRASEAPPVVVARHWTDRRFLVGLRLGSATMVGALGVVGEINVIDRLAIAGGIGHNVLGEVWGTGLRFRPHIRRSSRVLSAFTIEGSYSRSRYQGDAFTAFSGMGSLMCHGSSDEPGDPCYEAIYVTETIHWGQLEFGWEGRFRSGLTLRGSGGLAGMLNPVEWRCQHLRMPAACTESAPISWLPVMAFALGYAF